MFGGNDADAHQSGREQVFNLHPQTENGSVYSEMCMLNSAYNTTGLQLQKRNQPGYVAAFGDLLAQHR